MEKMFTLNNGLLEKMRLRSLGPVPLNRRRDILLMAGCTGSCKGGCKLQCSGCKGTCKGKCRGSCKGSRK